MAAVITRDIQPHQVADELLLVAEVEKRQQSLFHAFSGPGLGNKRKREAWEAVARAFNSQAGDSCPRTVDQLKKKFNNIKTEAKLKLSEAKRPKTGGGPPGEKPSEAEKMFLEFMGDTPGVCGIAGGLESLCEENATCVTPVEPSTSQILLELVATPSLPEENIIQQSILPEDSLHVVSCVPMSQSTPQATCTTSFVPTPQPASDFGLNRPSSLPAQTAAQFPPPGSAKVRHPRADKVASDLHIEVLQLEKRRIEAELEFLALKKQHALAEHELKMKTLNLKFLQLSNNH